MALTSERYNVTRGDYATLNDTDLQFFQSIVGPSGIVTDPGQLESHNVDWLQTVRGAGKLLLKPESAKDVSSILSYCHQRKLAVTPQGGNSGQSGGSVPVFDEIILSTSAMNRIISFDDISGVLVAEAGCVLQILNNFLNPRGFMMPLDLGAKDTCQLGGNISTNAAGLKLIRYGSLHSTVLGVEAVMADGKIMDCMSTMRKDNTGYDLKHLFIGSEGTLGVVTKVSIQCPVKSTSVKLIFLGLKTFGNVLEAFKLGKRDLGEILSACEYLDQSAISCVFTHFKLKSPIGEEHPYFMLLETSGSNEAHDEEKLENFLTKIRTNGIIQNGIVARDTAQMQEIWRLRVSMASAMKLDGYLWTHDLSVPVTLFDEFVCDVRKHFGKEVIRVCGFGHLGDSNIHLDVTTKEYDESLGERMEPFIYQWTANKKGSVSAEHGLGFKKKEFLGCSKSPEAIELMRQLKNLFDPHHILNPYKVFPN